MDGGATCPSPLPPNRHASLHEPRRGRAAKAGERALQGQLGWRNNERTRLPGNASFRQGGGDVFPKSLKVIARDAKLKYPGIGSVYGPFYDTEDRRF
jgi:hypothetical protein